VDDKNKVEIPHQTNQTEKDKSKFDWVLERSSCSLPKVFQTLRSQVEEDVKTRNGLRLANSPYQFSSLPPIPQLVREFSAWAVVRS
jgi:hypothetical protein